jgi:hypothetical protein
VFTLRWTYKQWFPHGNHWTCCMSGWIERFMQLRRALRPCGLEWTRLHSLAPPREDQPHGRCLSAFVGYSLRHTPQLGKPVLAYRFPAMPTSCWPAKETPREKCPSLAVKESVARLPFGSLHENPEARPCGTYTPRLLARAPLQRGSLAQGEQQKRWCEPPSPAVGRPIREERKAQWLLRSP